MSYTVTVDNYNFTVDFTPVTHEVAISQVGQQGVPGPRGDVSISSRKNVAAVLADTTWTYTAGQPGTVTVGDIVTTEAEGFSYEVLAPGASGDITNSNATPVQLKVLPSGDGSYRAEAFGVVDDGTDQTSKILTAIRAIRANPVQILDRIGGSTITAYSSGTLVFGNGVFRFAPDQIEIIQDVALKIKGQGSRRTNNSVRAATTLLVTGTSSGFGIKAGLNGGRGLHIEDLDLCYETSGFTGHLLDILSAPGCTLNRVFLGTFGLTSGTRLQTAASLIRATYDEFLSVNECVLDGAVDGIWFDDARTTAGNTFGGSQTKIENTVFYDFTGDMIRYDGLRTKQGLTIADCSFNPITANCDYSLDLNNVEGLIIEGNIFAGSVGNFADQAWQRIVNCTGKIAGNIYNANSAAGIASGCLDISGNRVFAESGFELQFGVITGSGNEFSAGDFGFKIAPTATISAVLGPDIFKSAVDYSYDIPADSTFLSAQINYSNANDTSTNKFRNVSARVALRGIDNRLITVASTPYQLLISDMDRVIVATGAAPQTFTLPAPVPGTRISVAKVSGQDLVVNTSAGTNIVNAGTISATSATLTGTARGSMTLMAYATVGWLIESSVGSWTYA